MSVPVVISGASINLYINNTLYKECDNVSFSTGGEEAIYGIDSPYPQEIAVSRIVTGGAVSGLRLKLSGGLQGKSMRSLFTDVAASPYISIRLQDRATQEDIWFVPQAKITRENHSVGAKGTYKLSFEFTAIMPLFALDRS